LLYGWKKKVEGGLNKIDRTNVPSVYRRRK
jgi:hypothetical protein